MNNLTPSRLVRYAFRMEPEKSGKVDQEAPQSSNSQPSPGDVCQHAQADRWSQLYSANRPSWFDTIAKLPAEMRSEVMAKLESASLSGKFEDAGRWLRDHADVDPNLRLSDLLFEMEFFCFVPPTVDEVAARIPHDRIEATTVWALRYLVIARCRMMDSMILGQHSKTMASRIEADAREYRAAVESFMNLQKSELEVRKLQSELAEAEAIAKEFPKII